jgi:hypothetical protein
VHGGADADLGEQMVADLVTYARLNLDCADIGETTARVLSRQTGYDRALPKRSCRRARRPAGFAVTSAIGTRRCMKHCRMCAEVCHRCQQACEDVLAAIGSTMNR